ncbi:MAG: tRNA pseudouridine(38-40) synthase TruA [bacterium]|nr:tRNA pseudouridine(38-40) synthase TruA [bacterium]
MSQRLKATVRYDGTRFSGWQVQPTERTVQGAIEGALARIAGDQVRIQGAGRTDAGVHAMGQVFSFDWDRPVSPETLRRSISRMLGPEIQIVDIRSVAAEFHARKSAVSKRYAYAFLRSREADPLTARYAWCVPVEVDLDAIRDLAPRLVGEHDFAGFQGGGASVKTTVRTIYSLELMPGGIVSPCDAGNLWRLEFRGNGFLYKMVRNITGTLIDIARGQLPEERLSELLESPGPFRGHTAPAHGLALVEVVYASEEGGEE